MFSRPNARSLMSALMSLQLKRSLVYAAGDGLELRHLQVVHRHGDRTPITPLADREFWNSVLPSHGTSDQLAVGTNIIRKSGSVPHPAAGDGVFGTLSARGVEQMRMAGAQLREMYAEFLPATPSHEEVRVHSTDFPRTIESVQALLQGLFSPHERRQRPIEIDATRSDRMIPDPVPRATTEQAQLEAAVLRSDAVLAHAAEVEPLRQRYSQVLRDAHTLDPAAYELSGTGAGDETDGYTLSWNKLAEVMKCLHAYHRLPDGLTPDDVRRASEAGAHRWTAIMRDSRIARLAMGEMATEIVTKACDAAHGAAHDGDAPASKLVLWSAHDSTFFGLLAIFDLDAPVAWPPYAAQLHIELLEEVRGRDRPCGWYVRFSLNGEVLCCALDDSAEPTAVTSLDGITFAVLGGKCDRHSISK